MKATIHCVFRMIWGYGHTILGPLLEVEMLKKCTPLWQEAHFQVKSIKKLRDLRRF